MLDKAMLTVCWLAWIYNFVLRAEQDGGAIRWSYIYRMCNLSHMYSKLKLTNLVVHACCMFRL